MGRPMSSRFEFLDNTTIGQYIPRESWFHQRDPRARLLAFVALFIGIIFTPRIWGLGLGLLVVIVMYLMAQLPIKPSWEAIKKAIPFLFILAILQIFLAPTGESPSVIWIIFGLEITQAGLMSSIMLLMRFIILITLINGFIMSLSTSQITAAMYYLLKPLEGFGFPVNDLTMVVQITLRYVPIVAQIGEKTAKAQASRGGDWEQHGFNPIRQAKRVLPLIVPLMVTSLKRAETMAFAMESRGFNAAKERSSFYTLNFTWQDGLLLVISLLLSGLMVLSGILF